MNYDSEEERKLQESLAEKLKATREFLSDKSRVNLLVENLKDLAEKLEPFKAKIRDGGKLTAEEKDIYEKAVSAIKAVKQSFDDMMLLLSHNNAVQADAYFFYVRKLAQEGNEEAKKIYEDLLPAYRAAYCEDFDSPEKKN